MREIKTLIQQLRNYPNNLFVYPGKIRVVDERGPALSPGIVNGLIICDKDGEKKGFIQTGTDDGRVVID